VSPRGLPVVVLKDGRDKSLFARHPWIFSGAIDSAPELAAGTSVDVRDAGGAWIAFLVLALMLAVTALTTLLAVRELR